MGGACSCCGCAAPDGARAHAIAAALRDDDLDGAITLGLLEPAMECARCATDCHERIDAARSERLQTLAARERHRARALRLERRDRERTERRKPAASADMTGAAATTSAAAPAQAPALPPAAAAALARAKARAAANRG